MSLTFSLPHFAYPMLVGTLEGRVAEKLGVSVTHGMGSYRGGLVGHWGVAAPFYPLGGFEGGLQLGPFGRLTRFAFQGDSSSTAPPPVDSPHRLGTPFFHDVETGRANGQEVLYAGVLIGGKFVVGHRGARAATPAWTRGITIQMGLMAGQLVPVGETGLGPHPLASRTAKGFSGQVYADVGCSF